MYRRSGGVEICDYEVMDNVVAATKTGSGIEEDLRQCY